MVQSPKSYRSIHSDSGVAPTWQQAIIRTNDGLVYWCMYASLTLDELTSPKALHIHLTFYVLYCVNKRHDMEQYFIPVGKKYFN